MQLYILPLGGCCCNYEVIAPGIADALFATAMGLAAAIPAVVFYNKFTVEIGRFAGVMQALIGRGSMLLSRAAMDNA